MTLDASFSGRPVPPGVVAIPSTTTAVWGSPSFSIAAGTGAPSGDLGATYYFNLNNFDLYRWDGAAWTGPHPFTYSTEAPTANDTTGPNYWVRGAGGDASGGIYGARTLVVSPGAGDGITWDAGAGAWVADPAVALTDEANTFTVGGQTINNNTAGTVPLTIRGASGQSANLIELKTNAGTNRLAVTDAGWINVGNAASNPSTASGGAVVYAESGELRARTGMANVGLTALRVAVKTGAHTFEGADQGAFVVLNSGSNFTFTIPEDATTNFPVGTVIHIATQASGHLTIAATGAATVTGSTTLNQAGHIGMLVKVAANTWLAHL